MAKRELLIIFDLNGTLIFRIKNTTDKRKALTTSWYTEHHFGANGTKVYKRNHLETLMKTISDIPNIQYAVWTSAEPKNASKISQKLFNKYAKQPLFVLNRTHCTNAVKGVKSAGVLKDLDKVFQSKELNENNLWNEVF